MITGSKHSRSSLLLSGCVVLLAFTLSGCGPDADSSSNPDPAPTSVPTQLPTQAPSINHQPSARITGTLNYTAGQMVVLDSSSSSDPDGDTLSYQWTQVDGPDIQLSNTTSATLTFVAPTVTQATQIYFKLTVHDGELSSSAGVSISVLPSGPITPANHQPSARISAPQSAIAGQTVTLNGGGSSDPDGDTLSYQWTQTGGPGIALSDSTGSSLTFVAPSVAQPQQISFQLTVHDGELASSTGVSMLISPIADNSAPSIVSRSPQPGESEVSPTAQIRVGFDEALLAGSVNSQSLVVSQNGSQVPGRVSYDSSSATVTFQPTSALSTGVSYTVTLTQSLTDVAGNAFAGASWSFTTGVCGTAEENSSLTLSCPSGQVINEVTFASYGTPGGSCGSFTTGACSASNSMSVVTNACKGMDVCTLNASNDSFGNPCNGMVKRLAAQVVCAMPTDPIPTPTPAPDTGSNTLVVAVNAGGQSTTYNGVPYQADNYYSTGSTYSTTANISGTSEDTVFQSERFGTFTYSIPVTDATYSLELQFAEIYYTSAGKRSFNVSVEGKKVLSGIDLFTLAGANGAYTFEVNDVSVNDGSLDIAIETVTDNGKISGFAVYSSGGELSNNTSTPTPTPTATPTATPPPSSGTDTSRLFVGNITTSGKVRSDFVQYWDQITPENEGKWESVEKSRDSYNWGGLDQAYNYAKSHNIIFKQHTFVWGSQYPSWINSLSASEQAAEIEEWISDFCSRYPDTEFIDVVNEATPGHAPANFAKNAFGNDWIIKSFQLARKYCPNATLILNDYNVLSWDTDKFMDMARPAIKAGVVDAIGLQAHGLESRSASDLKSKLDKLATLGLPIYISEYDVAKTNDQQQLDILKSQFPVFYKHPSVKGITLWGYVTGKTWLNGTGLIKDDGTPRPAMTWLMNYLKR